LNLKVRNREVKINLRDWLEGMEMSNGLGWYTYHIHIGLPSGARKIELKVRVGVYAPPTHE
jgi:hypothetical protein